MAPSSGVLPSLRSTGTPIRPWPGLSASHALPGRLTAADMVAPAFTGLANADGRGGSYNVTDKLHSTSTKLKPRQGPSVKWEMEFRDAVRLSSLTSLVDEGRIVERSDIIAAAAEGGIRLSTYELETFYADAYDACMIENSRLYDVVFDSLDLSGPSEQTDLRMIQKTYWNGDHRDGIGLLQWATGFTDTRSVASQAG